VLMRHVRVSGASRRPAAAPGLRAGRLAPRALAVSFCVVGLMTVLPIALNRLQRLEQAKAAQQADHLMDSRTSRAVYAVGLAAGLALSSVGAWLGCVALVKEPGLRWMALTALLMNVVVGVGCGVLAFMSS